MSNVGATSLKYLAESKVEGIQKATFFKVHPDKVEFEEGFNRVLKEPPENRPKNIVLMCDTTTKAAEL